MNSTNTTNFSFKDPYIIMWGKKRSLSGMSDSEKLFWWKANRGIGGFAVFSSDFTYTTAGENAIDFESYLRRYEREFYDRY